MLCGKCSSSSVVPVLLQKHKQEVTLHQILTLVSQSKNVLFVFLGLIYKRSKY